MGPPFVENSDGTRDAALFPRLNRGRNRSPLRYPIFATGGRGAESRPYTPRQPADVLIGEFPRSRLRQPRLDYQGPAGGQSGPRGLLLVPASARPAPSRPPRIPIFLIQRWADMDLTQRTPQASRQMSASPSPTSSPSLCGRRQPAAAWPRAREPDAGSGSMALFYVQARGAANHIALNTSSRPCPHRRLANAPPNIVPYQVFAA
jgi:hypothetical protein